MAVGDVEYGHKHVEHYENRNWTIKPDFPFVSYNIYAYSMATLDDELFIFGEITIFVNLKSKIY